MASESLLSEIDEALRNILKLRKADSLEVLLQEETKGEETEFEQMRKQGRFLLGATKPLKMVAGVEENPERVELELDCLIIDYDGQTIGLLHVLDESSFKEPEKEGAGTGAETRKFDPVESCVRQAVYIRHLLLETASANRLAYNVELVLVLSNPAAHHAKVENSLRKTMAESAYLFTIGVNLVVDEDLENEDELKRAFPWLLRSTTAWYEKAKLRETHSPKLKSLHLENFRLPGSRLWRKDNSQPLHVIHGHNGSGKSSITEALELLFTRKLQRIDREPNSSEKSYGRVLVNRNCDSAGVKLSDTARSHELNLQDGEELDWNSVGYDTVSSPGSFRLDQTFADELIHRTPQERAELLLESFFPQQVGHVSAVQDARARLNEAWAGFASLFELDEEDQSARNEVLGEMAEQHWTQVMLQRSKFDELKKITAERLATVSLFQAEASVRFVVKFREMNEESSDDYFAELHLLLGETRSEWESRSSDVSKAIRVLERFGKWEVQSAETARGSQGEFAVLVNQFLNQKTQVEVTTSEIELFQFAKRVVSEQKDDFVETFFLIKKSHVKSKQIDVARTQLRQFEQETQRLRDQIAGFRLEGSDESPQSVDAPDFSDTEQEVLDRLFPTLRTGEDGTIEPIGLGKLLKRVITRRTQQLARFPELREKKDQRVTSFQVGHGNWTSSLLDGLREYQRILKELSEADLGFSFDSAPRAYRELSEANKLRSKVADKAVEQLNSRLTGPLMSAVNELTALFTTARWGYKALRSDIHFGDEINQVDFRDEGPNGSQGDSFDLIWNTAELNSFALALFLLCAPTQPNPLNLYVLDDALQNMDELTVTTIARGLRRLISTWHGNSNLAAFKQVELLILLHSEDDVERLRSETRCNTYLLPWLTPAAESAQGEEPQPIESLQCVYENKVDSMKDFFHLQADSLTP